jgi:hypothetical protein
MTEYTLNELLSLAKFRSDRLKDLAEGDTDYLLWDDMTENERIRQAVVMGKALAEAEARKKNLGPFGFPKYQEFWNNNPISFPKYDIPSWSIPEWTATVAEVPKPEPVIKDREGNVIEFGPVSSEGPWESWSDVPEGIEYRPRGRYSVSRYVNRLKDQVLVRYLVSIGEDFESINSRKEMQELAPFVRVTPEPRVWNSLLNIPQGVEAEDNEGDVFRGIPQGVEFRFGNSDRWHPWTYDPSNDAALGPFTEVLND